MLTKILLHIKWYVLIGAGVKLARWPSCGPAVRFHCSKTRYVTSLSAERFESESNAMPLITESLRFKCTPSVRPRSIYLESA